ncbi:MAG: ribosome-binding factor A [Alphaproteobacteria bacterium]|nr:MAG: ribosome-binding factor A [Alphaproteobacteria bacterium]
MADKHNMYIPEKTTVSRTEKVKKEIHRFISEKLITGSYFSKVKLKHHPMITVARVEVSPDMRQAYIYFENFDQNSREDTLEFLKSISKELSREWAKISTMKYSPAFEFRIAKDVDEKARLQDLFDKIKD